MAAAAGGRGAWAARTGSGPVRMRGDIFATARRWRGRLLPTGHPASRLARRRRSGGGARREGCGGGTGGGVGVPRARPVAAGVRVDVIAPRAGGGGMCSWAASSSSVSTSRSFTPCSVFRAGGRRSVGWADVLVGVGRERVLGGGEEGGGVRRGRKKGVVTSRGGQERLGPAYFFHTISDRPPKQPH